MALSERDWTIRLYIYQFFVENTHPPTVLDVAAQFDLPLEDVRQTFHRLNDAHLIFLNPGTDAIRIANPLSAVPTSFKVHVGSQTLYANCAWDMLGIPAMLHADAQIEAVYAPSQQPVSYAIENGILKAGADLVHFAVPFNQWHDDLIHT